MEAKRVSAGLEEPGAGEWSSANLEKLELSAVPIGGQPSNYIRTVWADRPYGLVRDISAQAVHDGEKLYLRLEWVSPTKEAMRSNGSSPPNPVEGPDAFPDSLSVMIPSNGDARLASMGSDEEPVALWQWSADKADKIDELSATGIGSVRAAEGGGSVNVKVAEDGNSWQLVISRPLKDAPEFSPGGSVKVAFAVWAGVNQERGGIKSSSREWIELKLEK